MDHPNSDGKKQLPMQGDNTASSHESVSEVVSDVQNQDYELTVRKKNRHDLRIQPKANLESPQNSLVKSNESTNFDNLHNQFKSSEVSITSQECDNMSSIVSNGNEYEITVNKRYKNKKRHQEGSSSQSLIGSQARSDDANFEIQDDEKQNIFHQDMIIHQDDDHDEIGKMSTSRRQNNLFHFNHSSVSQHRLLSKQLEQLKPKINVQFNMIDSEKDNNDEDESEVEVDDNEDEAEYDDEEEENAKQMAKQILPEQQNQKSWKKNLVKDYLILEILGKGGQGKVATFLDKNNNNIIALKEFSRINEFDRESNIYKFLQQQTDLHDYINLMLDEDRSQRQIKLQMGNCNLYEMYMQMKNYNNAGKDQISWEEGHLIKIFRQLIHGLIAFRKNKFFHGDIKPHNIMLFSAENAFNNYMVKYIDLGAAGFENKDYYEFYSEEFCHPFYIDKVIMNDYVLDDLEINICEIYAIVRSIWIITCFEREDVNKFKSESSNQCGLEFIGSKYPRLANLMRQVVNEEGKLEAIEKIIKGDENREYNVSTGSQCLIELQNYEECKQVYSKFGTNYNYLKLNDQQKEMIQKIIQMKKEKFINEQSEDQLQELFEIFYSLGQDQRALEIFHQLEPSYEKLFIQFLCVGDETKSPNKKLSEDKMFVKVRVIKESIILLNEKGELDKAILWNKRLLSLFSSGKWSNDRESILQSIQYSILLNTKGDVMSSLQMSKDARNRYKIMLWETSKQDKEVFKNSLATDTLYGYICQVIGRLYIEINSYSNGLKYLKLALSIFEFVQKDSEKNRKENETQDSEIEYEDLNNMIQLTLIKLAQASLFLRHNNKALEFIDSAISLGKKMYGDRVNKQQASCLNIKSHILKQQNQDLKALELQNKCLEIRLKIHNQVDHRFISNSLNSISLLESKLGFHDKALQNQEQCYQMRLRLYKKNNPYHHQIIACLRNFGIIYQKMENYEMAEKYFLEGLQMAIQSNDLFQQINSHKLLEKLYKFQHKNDLFRHYQAQRIQAKLNWQLQKSQYQQQKQVNASSEQQSTGQSTRKLSSYTDITGSPTLVFQPQSDDEQGHEQNGSGVKNLIKSCHIKNQKAEKHQDIQQSPLPSAMNKLTASLPNPNQIQLSKKPSGSTKSQNKRYSNIKTNVPPGLIEPPKKEQEQKTSEKPRPKYKKKTRNMQLSQVIVEEGADERKEEEQEKEGFQQLLESQVIKDQMLDKKHYKKTEGKNNKRRTQKSFTEIPEIVDNIQTLQRKKTLGQESESNDISLPHKFSFTKVDNFSDSEEKKSNNKSLATVYQRGKTKSYQDQLPSQTDEQQKGNIKQSNFNKNSNKSTSDQNQDRKQVNKPKRYKKPSNANVAKVMKETTHEQEYVELVQPLNKQVPNNNNNKEPTPHKNF